MTDNYTDLARCMGCKPEEVAHRIQQHAPWNGNTCCESTLVERKNLATVLRTSKEPLLLLLADAVERGEFAQKEAVR